MTIKQLKQRVAALAKKPVNAAPVTMHEKLIEEYLSAYNKAIHDVLMVIDELKKRRKWEQRNAFLR